MTAVGARGCATYAKSTYRCLYRHDTTSLSHCTGTSTSTPLAPSLGAQTPEKRSDGLDRGIYEELPGSESGRRFHARALVVTATPDSSITAASLAFPAAASAAFGAAGTSETIRTYTAATCCRLIRLVYHGVFLPSGAIPKEYGHEVDATQRIHRSVSHYPRGLLQP